MITTVESTRKVDAGELARIVRKYTDSEVTVREQLEEAWAEMMKQKGEDGIAYCLGSLYLVDVYKRQMWNRLLMRNRQMYLDIS